MRASLLIAMVVVAPLTAKASIARVVDLSGSVERVAGDGGILALERGATVREGEIVHTGEDGHARLLVDDQAVVDLAPGSQLRIGKSRDAGSSSLGLLSGRLWARVTSLFAGNTVEVETPNAVAGVRGTSFFTEVDEQATTVSVEAGAVDVMSHSGERALIGASELAHVARDRFERGTLDAAGFEKLRATIAHRERGERSEREVFEHLRGGLHHGAGRDGAGAHDKDGRLREAIRESLRNHRDNPLDIDPNQARRFLERLRELRALRRAGAR